jgi:hypothetical protein
VRGIAGSGSGSGSGRLGGLGLGLGFGLGLVVGVGVGWALGFWGETSGALGVMGTRMGAVRGPSARESDPKFEASRRLVDGGGCVADRSDLSGVTQKSNDRPGT